MAREKGDFFDPPKLVYYDINQHPMEVEQAMSLCLSQQTNVSILEVSY